MQKLFVDLMKNYVDTLDNKFWRTFVKWLQSFDFNLADAGGFSCEKHFSSSKSSERKKVSLLETLLLRGDVKLAQCRLKVSLERTLSAFSVYVNISQILSNLNLTI